MEKKGKGKSSNSAQLNKQFEVSKQYEIRS
jgi:hypothetical protein